MYELEAISPAIHIPGDQRRQASRLNNQAPESLQSSDIAEKPNGIKQPRIINRSVLMHLRYGQEKLDQYEFLTPHVAVTAEAKPYYMILRDQMSQSPVTKEILDIVEHKGRPNDIALFSTAQNCLHNENVSTVLHEDKETMDPIQTITYLRPEKGTIFKSTAGQQSPLVISAHEMVHVADFRKIGFSGRSVGQMKAKLQGLYASHPLNHNQLEHNAIEIETKFSALKNQGFRTHYDDASQTYKTKGFDSYEPDSPSVARAIENYKEDHKAVQKLDGIEKVYGLQGCDLSWQRLEDRIYP